MEYALPLGIVIALVVVGLIIKQFKLFLLLAILAGAGAWIYLLNDEQKEHITTNITENEHVKELSKKVQSSVDDVSEQIEEQLDETEESIKEKAIEIYKDEKEKLSN